MRVKTESRVVYGDLTGNAPSRPGWFLRAALLGPIPKVRRISASYRGRLANLWDTQRAFTLWPVGKIPAGSCLASRFDTAGARKVMVVSIKRGEEYVDPPAQFTARWLNISALDWMRAAPGGGVSVDGIGKEITGIMAARPR
jgi:hypothetical protein